MKTARLRVVPLVLLGSCLPLNALAADPVTAGQPSNTSSSPGQSRPRFVVKGYAVDGAPQLPKADIDAAIGWLPGAQRSLVDIQTAQQALQRAYQRKGYDAVYVLLPEQEVLDGIVRFKAVEGRVDKVTIEGAKRYSPAAIRRALPALQEGKPLDAARLSQNIELANENPGRQLEVALGVDRDAGAIAAQVKVHEDQPVRVFATLDNTGNAATGTHRLGVALQDANLFGRDHTASLAYTTAPDSPSGVTVRIFSLGYRIPLYGSGNSLEAIYGNSNVNIPSGSPALGGVLGMTGKGSVLSLRWNHYLPRRGEYGSRLAAGVESQDNQQDCSGLDGSGSVAGCVGYRTLPLSLTYYGQLEQPRRLFGFDLGARVNAGGSSGATLSQATGRGVPQGFSLLRGDATLTQELPAKWQLRFNAQAQWSGRPLPASEQIGLAGADAVRGFEERAVASDDGALLQSELYTPPIHWWPGELRLLAFYDYGRGHDYDVASGSTGHFTLSSAGLGLRYQLHKNVFWRLDLAQVQHADSGQGKSRVHFSFTAAY